MRQAIYNAIAALNLGTYAMSTELPWDNNGQPLYLANLKRIYVDVAAIRQEEAIDTLDGQGSVDEITTIRVYFVNDAKQLPSNYDALVQSIKEARTTPDITGVIQRLCQVDTRFESDRLVTEFEFSFRKYLTN